MSRKNTVISMILVAACVLCLWYAGTPETGEISAAGTVEAVGDRAVISGDDGIIYIPVSGVPVEFEEGVRVSFTAVLNASDGSLYRGHYKPIDLVSISRG